MVIAARKLALEEFEAQYGHADRTYEYWYGEAISKGVPTWVHGLLQKIIIKLLEEQGFIAAPEVELRVEKDVHPKPDLIATKTKPAGPYPTKG
jgi:hypothetical protein